MDNRSRTNVQPLEQNPHASSSNVQCSDPAEVWIECEFRAVGSGS